jgi:hypothetical protein
VTELKTLFTTEDTKLMTSAPASAHQNPSTKSASTKLSVASNINAFTTKDHSPRVKIVIGNVNSLYRLPAVTFTIPKMNAINK